VITTQSNIEQRAEKPVVIVTGSSGLIGRAVIDRLRHDYQVVGFDKDGNPQPPAEVECVCVDLTDSDSVQRGLKRVQHAYGARIASVVHLAAYYDFSGEPSPLYEEVTVEGTRRLMKELQNLDMEVEQFIFSSTMLVHKPTEPGSFINEDAPLEGKWDYPQSKIKTEQMMRDERDWIPVVNLRIAGVYTDSCDSIPIAQQIQRIYENQLTSHVFPGDTSLGQAFVHLDDLCSAIRCAIQHRDRLPEDVPILIGEPNTYSYGALQREIARLIHGDADWQTHEIPKSVARTGAWVENQIPGIEEPFIKPWMVDMADDHYEIDISRARALLEWNPEHDLLESLPKMIAELQESPADWFARHDLEPPSSITERNDRPVHLEV